MANGGAGGASAGRGGDAESGGAAGGGAPPSEGGAPPCEPVGESDPHATTRFAIFGDYGSVGEAEAGVAELVKSWNVDFIATAGDNNYPLGEAETIDANIGQYFSEFICPYRGSYGSGATKNRFFPALGNHDWYTAGAEPYLEYFELPGNERYYDFVWGSVHLFMLDSDPSEPDGVMSDSRQAEWLSRGLAASTARWKIVVMHHAPYSSSQHGSNSYTQWPYKEWGADLVFAGHDHTYERLHVDGLTYIVAGLGGASTYGFTTTVLGSRAQYNAGYGAGLVEADATHLWFRFVGIDGSLIDEFTIASPAW
ncbi:MAG TPA: metallophosphoesterase [Polyangiaceae bacterium]|nr:metallophosphoesterase [Polyangiaceae bacterium]